MFYDKARADKTCKKRALPGKIKLMEKTLFVTLLIISIAVFFACNHTSVVANDKEPATPPVKGKYIKGQVIVKFKAGVTESRIKEISTSLGCEIIRRIGPTKTFLIKIKTDSVKKIVDKYKLFDEVEHAQPNYIYRTSPEK